MEKKKAAVLQCSAFIMFRLSHIHTWLLEKPYLWLYRYLSAKWFLCFIICYVRHNFSSKEQVSFNFVATVTIHSDFGAQKNKVNFFNSQPPAFYFSCTFCLPHPLVLKAPTEFSLPHPSEGRPKCYIHQELSHILSLGMHLSRKLLSTYT